MMRGKSRTQLRVAPGCEQGQLLPWVAFLMVSMLGIAGLSFDLGHAYVVRQQLQNEANAAALAAAGQVYYSATTSQASSLANTYGGGTYNAVPGANAPVITPWCVNLLMPTGQTCTSTSPSNAIKVTESAAMSTAFMRIFGMNTINIQASALASMQGAAQPWNVAVIVDGTASMGNTADSACGGLKRFQCAMGGIQTMLKNINPNGVFRVSVFSFPNQLSTGYNNTTTCSNTFTHENYTFPGISDTAYGPTTYTHSGSAVGATYQLVNWDSGYYKPSSTSTGGLDSTDNLVKAVGYNANTTTGAVGTKGCLPSSGGEGTYYAGVIYAAQAALVAEKAAVDTSAVKTKNAIILLTDGEAQSTYSDGDFPTATSTASTSTSGSNPISVTSAGSSSVNLTGAANSFGLYPDYHDECQQAIMAAHAATAAGTRVYSVAYGSEASGCDTANGGNDSSYVIPTGTTLNQSFTIDKLTPCITMEDMASSLDYFYSDLSLSNGGTSACQDSAHGVSDMSGIMAAIGASFTTPRLLPMGASGNAVPSF